MAKTLIGMVVSDKADKSIVVKVVTHRRHPLYKKQYIDSKKFMAHDEKNEAQTGDKVSIEETRPLSARKRYVLKTIIEKPAIRGGVAGDVEVVAAKEKKANDKKVASETVAEQEPTDE